MSKEYTDCDILEYVSGGPKQYQLLLRRKSDGKKLYKQKIRGFTLDRKNQLDYKEFRDMILKYREDVKKKFFYSKFGPTDSGHIVEKPTTKYYKPVCTKGILDSELNIIPFGFISGKYINFI